MSANPQPPVSASIVALGDSEALLKVISYVLAPDYPATTMLVHGSPPRPCPTCARSAW